MEESAAIAMAAAVAAAAELAKNGGWSFYHDLSPKPAKKFPVDVISTPEPDSEESSLTNENTSNDTSDLGKFNEAIADAGQETDEYDDEEDAEKRLVRSRERNREHARRTRLRKKAQLEALQAKAKELETESKVLKQSIEQCSIASILIGLSSHDHKTVTETLIDASDMEKEIKPRVSLVVGGKRKRFISEGTIEQTAQPLKLSIDGKITLIGGGKTHINWKSGVYCDENGEQRQLTQDQLENLRRERNRMHAKMTRDRKKGFISAIERTIEELETDNKRMRDALAKVANSVTPLSSPLLSPAPSSVSPTPDLQDELGSPAFPSDGNKLPEEKVSHGFSLSSS